MKYQSTSRTLCFLFHALIIAAFGSLGMFFGVFVVPEYFSTFNHYFVSIDGDYFLFLELAVLGLVLLTLSVFGLIYAIKGILKPSDDEPVVKSLTFFVAEGWVVSAFFLLQGVLLFDVVSFGDSKNLAFVIIMALLFAIMLLIATNIPMVRLYDGRDQTPLLATLSLSAGIVGLFLGVEVLSNLVFNWLRGENSFSAYHEVNLLLGIIVGVGLVIAVLGILASVLIKKKGAKGLTIGGFLNSASVFVLGGGLLSYAFVDMLVDSDKTLLIHFNSKDRSWGGYGFDVMAIIVGALAILGSVYFFVATSKDAKNKSLPNKKA
jgi:hypothetical protein